MTFTKKNEDVAVFNSFTSVFVPLVIRWNSEGLMLLYIDLYNLSFFRFVLQMSDLAKLL